jgi:hypothetical protein
MLAATMLTEHGRLGTSLSKPEQESAWDCIEAGECCGGWMQGQTWDGMKYFQKSIDDNAELQMQL